MGNFPSQEPQYVQSLKCPLKGNGMKVKEKQITELLKLRLPEYLAGLWRARWTPSLGPGLKQDGGPAVSRVNHNLIVNGLHPLAKTANHISQASFIHSPPLVLVLVLEGKYQVSTNANGKFSKVELALTSDGRTIVCYHPSVDIPYEHTKGKVPASNSRCRRLEPARPFCAFLTVVDHPSTAGPNQPLPLGCFSQAFDPSDKKETLMDVTGNQGMGSMVGRGGSCDWVSWYHRRRKKPNPPRDR
ncbi:hypothetical protein U0070_014102 [Myodes glareolus]|uniref:Large ribosomal subunit protein mL42 n=1 Tax=Myodes glareolus TaxID=447135 RepID=A0AAW0JEQ3_MYOGA